jgi:hypothetical protein
MVENRKIIVFVDIDLYGNYAQRLSDTMRRGHFVRRPGGKIHEVAVC